MIFLCGLEFYCKSNWPNFQKKGYYDCKDDGDVPKLWSVFNYFHIYTFFFIVLFKKSI